MFKNLSKKKHYKNKIRVQQQKIWDLQFLEENLKSTREGLRIECDRLKEIADAAFWRIDEERKKEDPDKTLMEQLQKLYDKQQPDINQLKKQIEAIDDNGDQPSPSLAKVKSGIENLETVKEMLEDIVKKL